MYNSVPNILLLGNLCGYALCMLLNPHWSMELNTGYCTWRNYKRVACSAKAGKFTSSPDISLGERGGILGTLLALSGEALLSLLFLFRKLKSFSEEQWLCHQASNFLLNFLRLLCVAREWIQGATREFNEMKRRSKR